MTTWDPTKPLGSDPMSTVDNVIRQDMTALQESLRAQASEGVEAVFPGADSSNPVYRYRGLRGTEAARPSASDGGRYFNTTKSQEERSNGTTWEPVGTVIESGTRLIFPQASVPTGWTQVTTHNDKMIRIVSGTGAGTGGTNDVSAGLSHTHTDSGHVHAIGSAAINHKHESPTVYSTALSQILGVAENPYGTGGAATAFDLGTFAAQVGPQGSTVFQKTSNMTDYAAGNTDSGTAVISTTAPTFKYVDSVIGSKD